MREDNKILNAQIAEARRAAAIASGAEPRAVAVRYERKVDRIAITLSNGSSLGIPRTNIQGLESATPGDLRRVLISTSGEHLRWASLDVDLSVPNLVNGVFGTSRWMRALGRKGGQVKSVAKAASARANGLLGGRPPKSAGSGELRKALTIGKLASSAPPINIAESDAREDKHIVAPLSQELITFGEEIRRKIKSCIVALSDVAPDSRNHAFILTWARTLGVLTWDIGGSCLSLLQHNQLRAPMILNRCLFEYQVRMRYYAIKPAKGIVAIEQLEERLRRVYKADPTLQEQPMRSDKERAEFENWLARRDKLEKENFRNEIIKTVYPKDSDMYYDGFYGKASAYVHGYETTIREIFRDWYTDKNPEPSFQSKILSLNDAAAVCIIQLLEQYRTLNSVGHLGQPIKDAEANWRSLQNRLGLDKRDWTERIRRLKSGPQ